MDNRLESIFKSSYSRYIYYAMRFVGDIDTAKDIVSDAFLAVLSHLSVIDDAKLNNYILGTIRNKSITLMSRTTPRQSLDDAMPLPDVEEREWMERERRLDRMAAAIKSMDSRTSYILKEHYYRHRTCKDIAAEIGITDNGVKKQLAKGITFLRNRLGKDNDHI